MTASSRAPSGQCRKEKAGWREEGLQGASWGDAGRWAFLLGALLSRPDLPSL